MNIEIIKDKTTTSKLTVTGNHDVRIKLAIGLDEAQQECIVKRLTNIADEFIKEVNPTKTFRGRIKGDGIQMLNDSKKEKYYYRWIF